MGWLSRIFGKTQAADAAPAPEAVPVAPAVEAPPVELPVADAPAPAPADLAPEVVAEIEALRLPAIRLLPQPGQALPEAPVSSLGGRPSLPEGMAWPEEDGRPMLFLAQINYAEMPVLEGYPTEGLLSVFLADDATQGCAFPSLDQAGFRSFHFADAGACVRRDAPGAPQGADALSSPLRAAGVVLQGEAVTDLPGPALRETAALQKRLAEAEVAYDPAMLEARLAAGKAGAFSYGGYPVFAQGDVRQGPLRFHAKVLLQLGAWAEGDLSLGFGDGGAANLLIKPKDLGPLRFDKVLYHYDSY